MPSEAQVAAEEVAGRAAFHQSARRVAGSLGAVEALSALLLVSPDASAFEAVEMRAQISQLSAMQRLAMRSLAALCVACAPNQTRAAAATCPLLSAFFTTGP